MADADKHPPLGPPDGFTPLNPPDESGGSTYLDSPP